MTNEGVLQGKVTKAYVAESGKFARLKIRCTSERRQSFIDVKFFREPAKEAAACKEGDDVTIKYTVESTCLKDKAGEDVKVDGYTVWVPELVGTSVSSPDGAAGTTLGDDKPPF